MTNKSANSCCQFDSNVVCTVNFFKSGLLCHLPGQFCVTHAHWKPNQRNQNFMILADSLHKVMSKC